LFSYGYETEGNGNTVEFGKHKYSTYFKGKHFNTVKSNNVLMTFNGAHQSK